MPDISYRPVESSRFVRVISRRRAVRSAASQKVS
jgi:hypothetical protein